MFELEQSRELMAHAELIEKANGGGELTAVENRILNEFLRVRARNSLMDYASSTTLGIDHADWRPSHFGAFIAANPGFHRWWERYKEYTQKNPTSDAHDRWKELVDERVKMTSGGT